MNWKEFTPEIKERGQMIFWDAKTNYWFEGDLVDDSEYGLCISLFETYTSIDNISHFLIPTKP